MASLGNFNADEFENTYTPIPAGKYTAIITASEMKSTKAGGQRLALTVEIVEGAAKGRKIFTGLNLVNSNPEAEKIAKTELANICRAVGIIHPRDSSELHGKPLLAKVSIKPETTEYPAGNEIKGWEAISTMAAPESIPTESSGTAGSTGKKPWEK